MKEIEKSESFCCSKNNFTLSGNCWRCYHNWNTEMILQSWNIYRKETKNEKVILIYIIPIYSIFVCKCFLFLFKGEQWSFSGSDGMGLFFLRERLSSMDFRWFCFPLTITINYFFFTNWPLDSMVFQWFWGHSTIAI